MAAKAIIADHQMMFTDGLQSVLKNMKVPPVHIVGVARNEQELRKMMHFTFDILILEMAILDGGKMDLIAEFKKLNASAKVIILTSYGTPAVIRNAFLKGADGYLLKSNQFLDLFECIEDVMLGKTYLAEGLRISPEKINHKKNADPLVSYKVYEDRFLLKQKLTRRETEILKLIVQSKSNKEIAELLYISDQTVSVHRKSIMKKLGTNTNVSLIRFALDNQLV